MNGKHSAAATRRNAFTTNGELAWSTEGSASRGERNGSGRRETTMDCDLEKSEQIQVEISESEHFLHGTQDADISIRSLAEKARTGRHSRFVLLDTPPGEGRGRGAEVAGAVRKI